jgi:hypothetical protein
MLLVIGKMPGGWSLYAGEATGELGHLVPVFVDPSGAKKGPVDAALSEHARPMFRCIKKWLDMADERMQYGASQEPTWKAADKAKLSMEIWMKQLGNWDTSLLDTELDPHNSEVG